MREGGKQNKEGDEGGREGGKEGGKQDKEGDEGGREGGK